MPRRTLSCSSGKRRRRRGQTGDDVANATATQLQCVHNVIWSESRYRKGLATQSRCRRNSKETPQEYIRVLQGALNVCAVCRCKSQTLGLPGFLHFLGDARATRCCSRRPDCPDSASLCWHEWSLKPLLRFLIEQLTGATDSRAGDVGAAEFCLTAATLRVETP